MANNYTRRPRIAKTTGEGAPGKTSTPGSRKGLTRTERPSRSGETRRRTTEIKTDRNAGAFSRSGFGKSTGRPKPASERQSEFKSNRPGTRGENTGQNKFEVTKRSERSFRTPNNDASKPFDRRRTSAASKPERTRTTVRGSQKFEKTAESSFGSVKRNYRSTEKTFRQKNTESENTGFSRYKTERKARSLGKKTEKSNAHAEMRLNRFISNAGVCSRREADKWIAAGMVTVNGKIVTELGSKVLETDDVRFDGQRLNPEKKVYLLLNKPKDYVTTTDDPNAEHTVMELVKNACPERIYPVGRLDKNTTGLLLFTNDGELSKRLTHPSHNVKKIYQVTLDKNLTKEDMLSISDGIELEDGVVAADAISYINMENKTEIGIEIHSGRNRVVRRIFEHLGYHVRKLDRVYFAGLTKKNVPRGKYRFLTDKEVNFLKMK